MQNLLRRVNKLNREEEMINFDLTKEQEKYLPAFEWLLSDVRAIGKSHLLAVAFIKKALNRRGEKVWIFGHSNHANREHMFNLIKVILKNKAPEILKLTEFYLSDYSILIKKDNK